MGGGRIDGGPRSAIVVGAAIVTGVAAGASWGNAGWISPVLTLPLNSPGVLRYGLHELAEQITTGKQPEAPGDFEPLRRTGR